MSESTYLDLMNKLEIVEKALNSIAESIGHPTIDEFESKRNAGFV